LSAGFRILSERLIHLNSSLHPNRTRDPIGTECPDYPAPLPHHRGTPAHRAIIPGMPIPRLDPEAGLARGCGERAHQKLSSKHRKSSSARRTASPPGGAFLRAAASGPPAGGRAREPGGLPFIALSPPINWRDYGG